MDEGSSYNLLQGANKASVILFSFFLSSSATALFYRFYRRSSHGREQVVSQKCEKSEPVGISATLPISMMATKVSLPSSFDISTELLIAQLLAEDLANIEHGKVAEQKVDDAPDTDEDLAMRMFVESARVTGDFAYAQSLHDTFDIASYQLAQKLAAAEKKIMLDAEFAKRLQAVGDAGQVDTDAPEMQDADSVLGPDIISSILAQDMNDKGKGKVTIVAQNPAPSPMPDLSKKLEMLSEGKGKSKEQDEPLPEYSDCSMASPYPLCGICFEPFQLTHSPISASLAANSSAKLPFGLRLPCPGQHPYCISCLVEYIKGKLDPNGTGDMSTQILVFPILCPECPITHWEAGIQDEVAEKVLDRESMSVWHLRKLLDSLPRQYCPNPKCSELVQIDEDPDDTRAQCPACFEWVCVSCKAMWHKDMNCEQYQSLPMDERSPEDQLAIELARSKQWRRCPGCHAIVELTQGCNHIRCLCKKEFCFKCGSLWDTKRQRCTSNPACELWDEMMLLDTREREREANANRVVQAAVRPAPPVRAAPPLMFQGLADMFVRARGPPQPPVPEPPRPEPPRPAPQYFGNDDGGDFDWIDNPRVANLTHPFTREMISSLTCGYCNNQLNSMDDLRYHLNNVRYHSVFSCCGRFFKRDSDLQKHRDAKFDHNHSVTRNA